MTRDVGKYVEGCDLYQRMKNRTEEPAEKLKLSEVPQKTWTHLTVDFIMKLLVVAGKDAILVVCDSIIYKSTCPENYIPAAMPPLNHTSLPSMVATFLTTCLMAVLQPSRYSIFHDGDTPIQLGLP